MAATQQGPRSLVVIGPGAGLTANKQVYASLQRPGSGWDVKIEGRSKAPYDAYPPPWQNAKHGQNLETFSQEIISRAQITRADCLLLGSRGGQVVLPFLWKHFGDALPPSVVLNGGCAMSILPTEGWQNWPAHAVTVLLMGGEDFFRGGLSPEQHLLDAMRCVPRDNASTAILYVDQMKHMPQAALLQAVLEKLLTTAISWKAEGSLPASAVADIIPLVRKGGPFTGRFVYKTHVGEDWTEERFTSTSRSTSTRSVCPKAPLPPALKSLCLPTPTDTSVAFKWGVSPRTILTLEPRSDTVEGTPSIKTSKTSTFSTNSFPNAARSLSPLLVRRGLPRVQTTPLEEAWAHRAVPGQPSRMGPTATGTILSPSKRPVLAESMLASRTAPASGSPPRRFPQLEGMMTASPIVNQCQITPTQTAPASSITATTIRAANAAVQSAAKAAAASQAAVSLRSSRPRPVPALQLLAAASQGIASSSMAKPTAEAPGASLKASASTAISASHPPSKTATTTASPATPGPACSTATSAGGSKTPNSIHAPTATAHPTATAPKAASNPKAPAPVATTASERSAERPRNTHSVSKALSGATTATSTSLFSVETWDSIMGPELSGETCCSSECTEKAPSMTPGTSSALTMSPLSSDGAASPTARVGQRDTPQHRGVGIDPKSFGSVKVKTVTDRNDQTVSLKSGSDCSQSSSSSSDSPTVSNTSISLPSGAVPKRSTNLMTTIDESSNSKEGYGIVVEPPPPQQQVQSTSGGATAATTTTTLNTATLTTTTTTTTTTATATSAIASPSYPQGNLGGGSAHLLGARPSTAGVAYYSCLSPQGSTRSPLRVASPSVPSASPLGIPVGTQPVSPVTSPGGIAVAWSSGAAVAPHGSPTLTSRTTPARTLAPPVSAQSSPMAYPRSTPTSPTSGAVTPAWSWKSSSGQASPAASRPASTPSPPPRSPVSAPGSANIQTTTTMTTTTSPIATRMPAQPQTAASPSTAAAFRFSADQPRFAAMPTPMVTGGIQQLQQPQPQQQLQQSPQQQQQLHQQQFVPYYPQSPSQPTPNKPSGNSVIASSNTTTSSTTRGNYPALLCAPLQHGVKSEVPTRTAASSPAVNSDDVRSV